MLIIRFVFTARIHSLAVLQPGPCTHSGSTTERRLMIDIAAAREFYTREDISNVGLVSSEHNMADGLIKQKQNKALEDLLRTGKDTNPVQQWIIRMNPSSNI